MDASGHQDKDKSYTTKMNALIKMKMCLYFRFIHSFESLCIELINIFWLIFKVQVNQMSIVLAMPMYQYKPGHLTRAFGLSMILENNVLSNIPCFKHSN